MPRKKRASIIDVAQAAGVSQATASRALSGHPAVSSQARVAVRQAAARLGYVRNLGAAGIASSSTTTVGLLVRNVGHSFYGKVAEELQAHTDELGLELLITAGGDSEEGQMQAINNLVGHGVGVVIVASGRVSNEAMQYAASFVPLITIGCGETRPEFDSVRIDPAYEAMLAQKVVAYGHRKVAVTATSHPLAATLHARTATFITQLVVDGVQPHIVTSHSDYGEDLFDGIDRAIDAGCTAVITGSDLIAVKILEHLASRGIACPEQMSVTGFDATGPYSSPLLNLTTVAQPVRELARQTALLAQERLAGSEARNASILLPGDFIEGGTLGRLPEVK